MHAIKRTKDEATTDTSPHLRVLLGGFIAMPAVDHCLTWFEESLKETMALRKSCEEANQTAAK